MRHTVIVSGGHAAALRRVAAAREGRLGMQALTIEQVAQRLAGGFLRLVDGDTLARLAMEAVAAAASEMLGDLAPIATLPGLPASLAATLDRAWRDGVELTAEAAARPGEGRLTTLARLEASVVARLPKGMLRPRDLVAQALSNRRHSPAVLGHIELDRLLDVDQVWRPLLPVLGSLLWSGEAPVWWNDAVRDDEVATSPRALTCATARHEVVEAMRWARSLLAQGVSAAEIAFAAATPGEFDDLVLAMTFEANLPIHFGHGRQALATQPGQAAAALADILLRGLSQDRVRRLAALAHEEGTALGALPKGWEHALPRAAPLGTAERWRQALTGAPEGIGAILLPAIDLLARGSSAAAEAGETFLSGTARLLWRRALQRAPAPALEGSLGHCGFRTRRKSQPRSGGCRQQRWHAVLAGTSGCSASTLARVPARRPRTHCCRSICVPTLWERALFGRPDPKRLLSGSRKKPASERSRMLVCGIQNRSQSFCGDEAGGCGGGLVTVGSPLRPLKAHRATSVSRRCRPEVREAIGGRAGRQRRDTPWLRRAKSNRTLAVRLASRPPGGHTRERFILDLEARPSPATARVVSVGLTDHTLQRRQAL